MYFTLGQSYKILRNLYFFQKILYHYRANSEKVWLVKYTSIVKCLFGGMNKQFFRGTNYRTAKNRMQFALN